MVFLELKQMGSLLNAYLMDVYKQKSFRESEQKYNLNHKKESHTSQSFQGLELIYTLRIPGIKGIWAYLRKGPGTAMYILLLFLPAFLKGTYDLLPG